MTYKVVIRSYVQTNEWPLYVSSITFLNFLLVNWCGDGVPGKHYYVISDYGLDK